MIRAIKKLRKNKNVSYQIMQVYIICVNRFIHRFKGSNFVNSHRSFKLIVKSRNRRFRRMEENRGWSWFEHVWICYWLMWFWGKRNFIVIYIRHSLENSFKFRLVQRNVWKESSRFFANPRKLSFHRTYLSRLAKFSICLKFVVKFKASRTCLVSSLIPLLDRFSTVFYCKLYIVLLENT